MAIKQQEVVWAPQRGSQIALITVPHKEIFEVLLDGDRGAGKTLCFLMDFLQHVGTGFGIHWRGLLFRRTYPELEDVRLKANEWIPQIFPAATFNQGKNVWVFPDGERLYFRHFLRHGDFEKYKGHNYPWIGWEELTTWPDPSGYLQMMSLCRSPIETIPRKYRATTNPYGPGHNWVKQRFQLEGRRPPGVSPIIDMYNDEGEFTHKAVAIACSVRENRILLDNDPEYLNKIKAAARNPSELAAWLYNDWSVAAGGMFDDVWDKKHHIVQDFTPPHSWKLNRSFDWGETKPFSVGWWAESDGSDLYLSDGTIMSTVRGDLFRFAEWYGWNGKANEGCRMLATDISRGIIERELSMGIYGRVKPGPADTSIFNVENGESIAISLGKPVRIGGQQFKGTYWAMADKRPGSRIQGWNAIRQRLKDAIPENGKPRERPGLFVCESCKDGFIRTVPALPRDDKNLDDVNTEAEDHVGDETRYRVRMGVTGQGSSRTVGGY